MFLYGYSLTSIFFSFKGESNDGIALVKITGSNKCKSSSADVLVVMPKARSTNGMGFFSGEKHRRRDLSGFIQKCGGHCNVVIEISFAFSSIM